MMNLLFKRSFLFVFVYVSALSCVSTWQCASAQTVAEPPIERILFGSCIQQDQPTPIFDTMLAQKPELLLFLGDNIYADTTDMTEMQRKYAVLAGQPKFQALLAACPVMATWDDHDFGLNDAGADYEQSKTSQHLFLDFWNVPIDSPRRKQEGVYHAALFGPTGKRLQIIMLDTRYFRSPLKTGPKRVGGPYYPDNDPTKTMLGEAQWKWLEDQLGMPADLRILVSSIQCVSEAAGHETWANLPLERQRLYDLIKDTVANGLFIISGDRHWAELSVSTENETPYPLFDLTSSSLNQIHPRGAPTENAARALPATFHRENFGVIQIDWESAEPSVQIEVRDVENRQQISKRLRFSDLQP